MIDTTKQRKDGKKRRNEQSKSKNQRNQYLDINNYWPSQRKQSKKRKRDKSQKKQAAPEYGDPRFVCFKIANLEFYSKAQNYALHSRYFKKLYEKHEKQMLEEAKQADDDGSREEEIFKTKQIVMRLPDDTLPSTLHHV